MSTRWHLNHNLHFLTSVFYKNLIFFSYATFEASEQYEKKLNNHVMKNILLESIKPEEMRILKGVRNVQTTGLVEMCYTICGSNKTDKLDKIKACCN